MSKILIRDANPEDYSSIAKIISEHNHKPESHCIQSSSTSDPSSIEQEIVELYSKEELLYVVAEMDGQLAGLLGCEYDQSVGRGWMRGPFLVRDQWDSLPQALLETLLAALPPVIRRLDSFLNQEHSLGNRFYLENGFLLKSRTHVYFAQADGWEGGKQVSCNEIEPKQEQDFVALHESAFPVTYIKGKGILNQLDEDHKLFIYAQHSPLDGYIYVSVDRFAGEGYIEYIAVQPELRGRGIGKALLQCAMDWCFSTRGLGRVALTVHEELADAQSLYESVGFHHLYTGVNQRREW
jgi:ribosomal protein S18 acetylase RimI-like enzyme